MSGTKGIDLNEVMIKQESINEETCSEHLQYNDVSQSEVSFKREDIEEEASICRAAIKQEKKLSQGRYLYYPGEFNQTKQEDCPMISDDVEDASAVGLANVEDIQQAEVEPCEIYIKQEPVSEEGETDFETDDSELSEEQTSDELEDEPGPSEMKAGDQGQVSGRTRRGRPQERSYKWTDVRPEDTHLEYSDTPGLKGPIPGPNPIDFFNLLFTDRMRTLIVDETNRFANKLISKAQSTRVRINSWKPLVVEEFMIWLGLLYHMGSVQCCRIQEYWSTNDLFSLPLWRRCMGRDRFLNILASLHFSPNPPQQSKTDRLHKIKPLLDIFHDTMEAVVTPTRRLCIEEPMVLWRGRLVFCVYLKGNRRKYRVKLYTLAEPSGLALRIIVYAGASEEVGGPKHSDSIVQRLMEGKLDIGHSLFTDSYYNSVRLAYELLTRRTYVTGTLRPLRKGNPLTIVSSRLRKGESTKLFSEEGICVLKWKDRRDVLMISSEFGPDMMDVINLRGHTSSKPEMFVEYNKSMGGVDRQDQLMAYYPVERKILKWYKKLGIHLFQVIMINAHVLYCKTFPDGRMDLHAFRQAVIRALLSSRLATSRPPPQHPTPPSPLPGAVMVHKPSQRPRADSGRRIQRRCVVCVRNHVRKRVTYYCAQCPNEPHLCIPGCFNDFHS